MLLIKLQMYTKKKTNFHIIFYLTTKKGLQSDTTLNFFHQDLPL